jgi:hypothetical protein
MNSTHNRLASMFEHFERSVYNGWGMHDKGGILILSNQSQRRHQKIFEEAPTIIADPAVFREMVWDPHWLIPSRTALRQ